MRLLRCHNPQVLGVSAAVSAADRQRAACSLDTSMASVSSAVHCDNGGLHYTCLSAAFAAAIVNLPVAELVMGSINAFGGSEVALRRLGKSGHEGTNRVL